MDLRRSVDLYCERTDPGLWSEPLNAASNAAFLVAAALILRHARAPEGGAPFDARLLAALVALVGAGSFLFHTFATVWAAWLDVLFILGFIYAFLARFLARVAGWGRVATVGGLAAYWLAAKGLTAPFPPGTLNGSTDYLPPLLALVVLAVWARGRGHAAAARLAADHPKTTFILQHAGMLEDLSDDGREEWRQGMRLLAAQPNVVSKLSGLGTFIHRNDPAHLAWVVRETVALFGAERCMWGSNFPIEKIWTDYGSLVSAIRAAVARDSPAEAPP